MIRRIAFAVAICGPGIVLLCGVAEAEQCAASKPTGTPGSSQHRRLGRCTSRKARLCVSPILYSYWGEIYPQFYGGFHYRQIYEFGPPGDFGIRGSPW